MKFQSEAATVIEDLGVVDRFGIVHDTFQHALAHDETFLVPYIRLVHISGVSRGSGGLTARQDAERVLVDAADCTDALGQIRRLIAAGYRGPFSFECTDPGVCEAVDPTRMIAQSISHIRRELAKVDSAESAPANRQPQQQETRTR